MDSATLERFSSKLSRRLSKELVRRILIRNDFPGHDNIPDPPWGKGGSIPRAAGAAIKEARQRLGRDLTAEEINEIRAKHPNKKVLAKQAKAIAAAEGSAKAEQFLAEHQPPPPPRMLSPRTRMPRTVMEEPSIDDEGEISEEEAAELFTSEPGPRRKRETYSTMEEAQAAKYLPPPKSLPRDIIGRTRRDLPRPNKNDYPMDTERGREEWSRDYLAWQKQTFGQVARLGQEYQRVEEAKKLEKSERRKRIEAWQISPKPAYDFPGGSKSLISQGLEWLAYLSDSLDKPGRVVRGLVGARPREALNIIPYSDYLGITKYNQMVSGRKLLEKLGWAPPDKPGFDLAEIPGFFLEIVLDPMTYAAGLGLAGKGGKVIGIAGRRFSRLVGLAREVNASARAAGETNKAAAAVLLADKILASPAGATVLSRFNKFLTSKILAIGGKVERTGIPFTKATVGGVIKSVREVSPLNRLKRLAAKRRIGRNLLNKEVTLLQLKKLSETEAALARAKDATTSLEKLIARHKASKAFITEPELYRRWTDKLNGLKMAESAIDKEIKLLAGADFMSRYGHRTKLLDSIVAYDRRHAELMAAFKKLPPSSLKETLILQAREGGRYLNNLHRGAELILDAANWRKEKAAEFEKQKSDASKPAPRAERPPRRMENPWEWRAPAEQPAAVAPAPQTIKAKPKTTSTKVQEIVKKHEIPEWAKGLAPHEIASYEAAAKKRDITPQRLREMVIEWEKSPREEPPTPERVQEIVTKSEPAPKSKTKTPKTKRVKKEKVQKIIEQYGPPPPPPKPKTAPAPKTKVPSAAEMAAAERLVMEHRAKQAAEQAPRNPKTGSVKTISAAMEKKLSNLGYRASEIEDMKASGPEGAQQASDIIRSRRSAGRSIKSASAASNPPALPPEAVAPPRTKKTEEIDPVDEWIAKAEAAAEKQREGGRKRKKKKGTTENRIRQILNGQKEDLDKARKLSKEFKQKYPQPVPKASTPRLRTDDTVGPGRSKDTGAMRGSSFGHFEYRQPKIKGEIQAPKTIDPDEGAPPPGVFRKPEKTLTAKVAAIVNANPYHDRIGRFTFATGEGGGGGSQPVNRFHKQILGRLGYSEKDIRAMSSEEIHSKLSRMGFHTDEEGNVRLMKKEKSEEPVAAGRWHIGSLETKKAFVEKEIEGETKTIMVRIYKIPVHYTDRNGETETAYVGITRGGKQWQFTWPDGTKQGTKPKHEFLNWFHDRFGSDLHDQLEARLPTFKKRPTENKGCACHGVCKKCKGKLLFFVANFSGSVRREHWKGKDWLVAPVSLIVEGVLNGSKGPLHYPMAEIKNNYRAWNNVPIVVYHPTDNQGSPQSAKEEGVVERSGIGVVRNADIKHPKLKAEGWFDIERTKKVDKRVYNALINKQKIELSTGLFTDNEAAPPGAHWNGKNYTHIARNYRPDHLAILPDQVGACSINDGCGVLVNSNPHHDKLGRFAQSNRESQEAWDATRAAIEPIEGQYKEKGTYAHHLKAAKLHHRAARSKRMIGDEEGARKHTEKAYDHEDWAEMERTGHPYVDDRRVALLQKSVKHPSMNSVAGAKAILQKVKALHGKHISGEEESSQESMQKEMDFIDQIDRELSTQNKKKLNKSQDQGIPSGPSLIPGQVGDAAQAGAGMAGGSSGGSTQNASTLKRVNHQLKFDYPPKAREWLEDARWVGPVEVPTEHIDYSNKKKWRAHHEQDKVKDFEHKIKQGKLKPIILVKTPGKSKYIVIDGHHRALAYEGMDLPAMAYVGKVNSDKGPWDEMHANQYPEEPSEETQSEVTNQRIAEIIRNAGPRFGPRMQGMVPASKDNWQKKTKISPEGRMKDSGMGAAGLPKQRGSTPTETPSLITPKGTLKSSGGGDVKPGESIASTSDSSLTLASNALDKQGGELPIVSRNALKTADFITLSDSVKGTNCSNCRFVDKKPEGAHCDHPKLKGQPVTNRNCCGYWDARGVLRNWKSQTQNTELSRKMLWWKFLEEMKAKGMRPTLSDYHMFDMEMNQKSDAAELLDEIKAKKEYIKKAKKTGEKKFKEIAADEGDHAKILRQRIADNMWSPEAREAAAIARGKKALPVPEATLPTTTVPRIPKIKKPPRLISTNSKYRYGLKYPSLACFCDNKLEESHAISQ